MPTSIARVLVALGLGLALMPARALAAGETAASVAPTAPAAAPAAVLPAAPATPAPPVDEADAKKDAAEKARLAARAQQVDELAASVKEFESQVREYRGDVQLMIERKYQSEKTRVSGEFEKQIRDLESSEREERLGAIALFEKFIARYPDDERYSPDAMTRLAELYYEKTMDDQQVALAEYEERAKLGTDEPSPEMVKSFVKSIALYQQLITRFPSYRLIDSIYYLLGFCLSEQEDQDEARKTFAALIEKFPNSKYVPEAWVRVGDYYFNDTSPGDANDKLRQAIYAYLQATRYKDSPLFGTSLYKLGWSYYRIDDFDHAVDSFISLVDFYDQQKDGKDGGEMRAEALQYTAISFADDKWAGTETRADGTERFLGVQKMADYFKRIGGRSFEYEMFRKLGDVLFDSTKYEAAVEAYRIVIARKPNSPDAPQTQDRIVQAFVRAGDKEKAFAERQILVDTYGEKGAWAEANKADHDVLKAAVDLVERNLLSTAQFHHQQAAEYDKRAEDPETPPEKKQQATILAFQSYQRAAKAYGEYLKAFPHSKQMYDIQFYHAETLYRSLQFLEAANEYARVRDSNADNKYLATAAYYVVLALQREIQKEEGAGLLDRKEACTYETCKGQQITELELPAIRARLIEAADFYMQRTPTAEDAPQLSYTAARTFFTYGHWDEAKRRYEDVIKRFPDNEVSFFAYEDILTTWLLKGDWNEVEKGADRMIRESKFVQNDPERLKQKRLLKYGARFNRAQAAFADKKWSEAATLYMSIVDETEAEKAKYGSWEKSDAALFNAATCFKEFRKFDSAMRTYERLYQNYPSSPLAEQALFFVAENAEKAFEFEKAIDRYMLLFKNYPQSKDRIAALFNAAKLLESMQRYKEAADAYKLYARTFENESDAPAQAFQATVMYKRMKDYKGLIDGFQAFIKQFDRKPEQAEKIVQAYQEIGRAYLELGQKPQALAAFKQCVAEYDKKKMTPENYAAAAAAAEARFLLVEEDYAEYAAMKFDPKGKGPKLAKSVEENLKAIAERLQAVDKAYTEVIVKYQWPEWMMAALFRIGNLNEEFANKLLNSQCPGEIKALAGEDGCTEYRIQLETQMAPINDKAQAAYERAQDKAIEQRVSNQWTKLTNEKVCQLVPSKCVSLKDPTERLLLTDASARPLARDAQGVAPVVYPANAAVQAPIISDVKPRRVSAGETLTIIGSNFNGDATSIVVTLGELQLQITAATPTELKVVIPPLAKTATLSVQTQQGVYATAFQVEVGLPGAEGIGTPEGIGATPGVEPAAPAPAAPAAPASPAPAAPASPAPAPAAPQNGGVQP